MSRNLVSPNVSAAGGVAHLQEARRRSVQVDQDGTRILKTGEECRLTKQRRCRPAAQMSRNLVSPNVSAAGGVAHLQEARRRSVQMDRGGTRFKLSKLSINKDKDVDKDVDVDMDWVSRLHQGDWSCVGLCKTREECRLRRNDWAGLPLPRSVVRWRQELQSERLPPPGSMVCRSRQETVVRRGSRPRIGDRGSHSRHVRVYPIMSLLIFLMLSFPLCCRCPAVVMSAPFHVVIYLVGGG
ncbi:hypothetical protein K474DRAFT_952562 [Panus rudis PR-1116 ss-1]|nr:hypothetical protein K474DRAFT_952562 [Panus rudis PR-1116 ss-1]